MFMSVQVPRGSVDDECAAVQRQLADARSEVYVPALFLKMALEAVRHIESSLHLNLSPLVGTELALMARERAKAAARSVVSLTDLLAALPSAIAKNGSQATDQEVVQAAALHLRGPAQYLQHEIPECDFPALIRKLHEFGGDITQEGIKKALLRQGQFAELEALARWITRNEQLPNFRLYEAAAAYLSAYTEAIALEIKARQKNDIVVQEEL